MSVLKRARSFMDIVSRATPDIVVLNYLLSAPYFFRGNKRWPKHPSAENASFNDLLFYSMIRTKSYLRKTYVDKAYAKLLVGGICPELQTAGTIDVISVEHLSIEGMVERLKPYVGRPLIAKPTHISGGIVFLDAPTVQRDFTRLYKVAGQDYFFQNRERVYRHLERKIIVEPNLNPGADLHDFKFFCARGEVFFCQVDTGRFSNHRRRLYLCPSWTPLDVGYTFELAEIQCRPSKLDLMIQYAHQLSETFDFVRVDLYEVKGTVYFGELTFYPDAATKQFSNINFGLDLKKQIEFANTR